MSDEEKTATAIDQREEANFLSRQLLAVGKQLRIMGVIGIVTAIGIGVQDHFLLRTTSQIGLVNSGRIDEMGKLIVDIPRPASRWTWGMMLDWTRQLAYSNPSVTIPPTKEIHESHIQDR